MKKWLIGSLAVLMLIAGYAFAAQELFAPGQNNTGSIGKTGKAWKEGHFQKVTLNGVQYTFPAADGVAGTYLSTDAGGGLSWTAGTAATLDQAYDQGGAGVGAVIAVDAAAVQLNGTHASNNTFFINKSTGSGHGIQVTNAGTGKDINGTSNLWSVTKAGLGTFVGATVTGVVDVSGGTIKGASPLVFEGATVDSNQNTFAFTDPTVARTTTFPNASGTVDLLNTATKDYGGAHADWTLSVDEQRASFITATGADAPANILLSAGIPGKIYFVYNNSGAVLTFKVTGQTGGTIANGKRALYVSDAVDLYEIWEQS